MISRRQPAPDDADVWRQVEDKAHLLDRRPGLRKGEQPGANADTPELPATLNASPL